MAEPVPIVADPISSDGSEESWILLDEMDEAMNEEFNSSQLSTEGQSDQTTSTDTLNESNEIDVAREAVLMPSEETMDDPSYVETMSSEAISACPSNDEDDDDDDDDDAVNDTALSRSVLENSNTLQVYDDLNDGSTTDGSISILGDHEHNQGRFDSDDLSIHTPAPPPLQMWMRCTPIDMTICSKRPLEARPRCQQVTSVAELDSPQQNIVDEVLKYLERLNHFLSSIYMLQVILLFLTAGSVAFLAIIYSRYSACKLEVKDLEQKLYTSKMDKYQIEGNLARCEYLYEMEVEKTTSTEFKPAPENVEKTMPAVHGPTNCQTNDLNGECVIQPTRLSENHAKDADIKLQTVWTGEGDDLLSTKKPYVKVNYLPECNDESSLFSEYNREYCELQKKPSNEQKDPIATVYATHYSYKAIDDKECNPNKIDFSLGIEHARKILRETKCDDEGTMKYLQKAYENYQTKLRDDQSKTHKEYKKIDKTNGKWEKTQKFNNSVIKIDKYDEHLSSEERFDRKEKKDRRDRKHQKEKESDKENKRKHDRKDGRKPIQEKDTGKWNKNDRKRDMVKVYDHRHGD